MKTLLIVAGVFFSAFGGTVAYFASADPGHDYDLKLVLPVDTRQMPRPVALPTVAGTQQDTDPTIAEGRAVAQPIPGLPESPDGQGR